MFRSIGTIAAGIYCAMIVWYTAQLTDSVSYLTITSIAVALMFGAIGSTVGGAIDNHIDVMRQNHR